MSQAPEDHLPPYRVRPRFQIDTAYSMEVLTEKINAALAGENAPCRGQAKHGYATLYLPKVEQHYWSPQLTLSYEESEKGTLIRGLYGPRPAVWTMFIFFYSLIAFAFIVISVIGFSNFSLGHSASILFVVPILFMTFLTLYFVAYCGQRLGHDQMLTLHGFLEETLK